MFMFIIQNKHTKMYVVIINKIPNDILFNRND